MVLYAIWGLIPLVYFGLAIQTRLDTVSKKRKRDNAGELFRQGAFCLICALIAVGIDQKALQGIHDMLAIPGVPFEFFQVMLLPVVLYVGAIIAGPTKNKSLADTDQRKKTRARTKKRR